MAKTTTEEKKHPATGSSERYKVDRKADGTISINIHVPAADIEKVREQIVSELIKQVELPGFRKGAAPRKLAEEKLKTESVREEVLKKTLTNEYVAAVKSLNINPIINPRIHVEQFAEGTDLEFLAETCEEPKVELKNYKDEIKKMKPAPKIIVPGQPEPKEDPNKKLDDILASALSVAEITIPKVLIEQEAQRLLSQLLEEIKRLGVTLDNYLATRGKKDEELRKEYEERAERDLKLEFMLRKIADEEKITVEKEDIEKAIGGITDEKQRQEIASNPYLVAAIIRQQKTLDFLSLL